MPVMPSPARKQKIVRVLFKKRAIELQTAVTSRISIIIYAGDSPTELQLFAIR